ncbi:SDR family oxidoreductase [Streptomyces ambofaciens]
MASSPISDDLRLPADIDASALTDVPEGPPERILLTGATGFLGGFLLADLLDATDARIHCLVRAESAAQAPGAARRSVTRPGCAGAPHVPDRRRAR